MGVADHKKHAPRSLRAFVVTISDTRTEENDTSGQAAQQLLTAAGHIITGYRVVKDEPAIVAELIKLVARENRADVVITSGGTGISRRDATYEAVTSLLSKRLGGFGGPVRMLS